MEKNTWNEEWIYFESIDQASQIKWWRIQSLPRPQPIVHHPLDDLKPPLPQVCKDGFGAVEAQVVCNELGLVGPEAQLPEVAGKFSKFSKEHGDFKYCNLQGAL